MGVTTIDQQIADIFNKNFNVGGSWNWGNLLLCILAIILSIVLCGLVGLERERKGRSAGFRTHLLVGLGSCLVMIISIYGFPLVFTQNQSGTMYRDVARLAAAIITGVGFLGAGAIIHHQGGIKGLTTASTVWIVMAIGIACGSMNFVLAVLVTIATLIVLVLFRKFEKRLRRNSQFFSIVVGIDKPILTDLLKIVKEMDYTISEVNTELITSYEKEYVQINFKIASNTSQPIDVVLFSSKLESLSSIKHIQIQNNH